MPRTLARRATTAALAAGIAATLLAGCSSGPKVYSDYGSAVDAFLSAVERGDVDAIIELSRDDLVPGSSKHERLLETLNEMRNNPVEVTNAHRTDPDAPIEDLDRSGGEYTGDVGVCSYVPVAYEINGQPSHETADVMVCEMYVDEPGGETTWKLKLDGSSNDLLADIWRAYHEAGVLSI